MDRGSQLTVPAREHSEFLSPGAEISFIHATWFVLPFFPEESESDMVTPHLEKEHEIFVSSLLPRGTMWDKVVRDRFFLRGESSPSPGNLPVSVVVGLWN